MATRRSKSQVVVMLGTKKGAFILRSDKLRRKWQTEGPHFPGWQVFHLTYDPRDGKSVYAATNNEWFGSCIHISRDLGKTWHQAKSSPKFDKKANQTVKKYWHVTPGPDSQPRSVWVGTQPAGLFRSDDWGETYKPVKGLNDHPTKDKWGESGGGPQPDLHTIAFDPANPKRMYIAISSGGAYRSDDAGKKWHPINKGTAADFMPGPPPEVGQ